MFKNSWKKMMVLALTLGIGGGSASVISAQPETAEIAPGGYPNQCYYSCGGCGGGCLGQGYICCKQ